MKNTKFTKSDVEYIAFQLLLVIGKRTGCKKHQLKTYFSNDRDAKKRYCQIAISFIKSDFNNSKSFYEEYVNNTGHRDEKESEYMRNVILERFESQK